MPPRPNLLARIGWPILFLLPSFLFPLDAKAGLIQGRVVNRTLSQAASNCVVTLIRHGHDDAKVERDTTDLEGGFTFEIGPGEEGKQTFLSAAYSGVDYFHSEVTHDQGPYEIAVYETTRSETVLSLVSHHIVIDARADSVIQILIAQNSGDRTYLTGEGHGHGLEVLLPDGVTGVQGGPQGLHAHGGLLIDARPVEPGPLQLAFALKLPPSRRLLQEVRYPTESVDVLVTPADAQVLAPLLKELGEVTFGQRRFLRFSGADFKPGDTIDISLGTPASAELFSEKQVRWALGGLVLIMALLVLYFRPRRSSESRTAPPPPPVDQEDIMRQRGTLLKQIADLDDRHEAGELSESDYNARREALMAEVVLLTRSLDSDEA